MVQNLLNNMRRGSPKLKKEERIAAPAQLQEVEEITSDADDSSASDDEHHKARQNPKAPKRQSVPTRKHLEAVAQERKKRKSPSDASRNGSKASPPKRSRSHMDDDSDFDWRKNCSLSLIDLEWLYNKAPPFWQASSTAFLQHHASPAKTQSNGNVRSAGHAVPPPKSYALQNLCKQRIDNGPPRCPPPFFLKKKSPVNSALQRSAKWGDRDLQVFFTVIFRALLANQTRTTWCATHSQKMPEITPEAMPVT
jgi:hypothetical protein